MRKANESQSDVKFMRIDSECEHATSPLCHKLTPILISSHSKSPSAVGGAGARTRSTGMSKGKGNGGAGLSAGGAESSSNRELDGDEWFDPGALNGLISLAFGAAAPGPRVCTGEWLHSRSSRAAILKGPSTTRSSTHRRGPVAASAADPVTSPAPVPATNPPGPSSANRFFSLPIHSRRPRGSGRYVRPAARGRARAPAG